MACGKRLNQAVLMSRTLSLVFTHRPQARHLHRTFIVMSDKMGKPDPRYSFNIDKVGSADPSDLAERSIHQ